VPDVPWQPTVSVIVPVYKGERFLDEALESVAAQTYAPLETIVVDDGSPDRCAEIAAGRPGVRVVRQSNQGVASARNAGLAEARGELVAFLDQDDQWLAQKLALQVSYLFEHPDVAVVLTHMELVLLDGTPRPPWFRPNWLDEPQPGFTPSVWLVRREAFERVGPFDTGYEVACDSDWLARAKDVGLLQAMLADVLVRWRVHGANGTYDQDTMRREMLSMVRASAARQRQASLEAQAAHAG
jgi:glycosyltransferase involved in cell wall biosynthesis